MTHLSLSAFGPPRIDLDGRPVVTDRNKAVALLVYLAVASGEHTRQSLATLLWPDYDQSRALAYLRRTLWALIDVLGPGWVEARRETVSLSLEAGIDFACDVWRFHELLESCTQHGHPASESCRDCIPPLSEAAGLYRDDFLAGFSLRDSPNFDEWQFFQTDNLRRELAGALERLARAQGEQGQWEAALAAARRWLALDPLQEAAHCELMRLYDQAGQRSAALRQYQECVRLLDEELGVPPQPETTRLYEQIKAGALPARKPPVTGGVVLSSPFLPPTGSGQVSGLPLQPTPFIGRVEELARIAALLQDPECRLLTLIGPGGMGKTRLAIEAARRASELSRRGGELPGLVSEAASPAGSDAVYTNGIFFIPLAPLASPEFLVQTVAEGLKFSFRSDQAPRPQLLNYLSGKSLLLVLDNFEHLVSAAELLSEILAVAPGVKILVTSRERLNLPEEWLLEIRGMLFPGDDHRSGLEMYSAVRLFLQSARRVRAGFTLGLEDEPAVARICRLVEGMPLGIELAAAWVRMLSCQEIAAEIEQSIDFLSTSLRGVPDRHQSLRAVFEHSWRLLTPGEQSTFRRLSVFRSSFTLDAARAVIGAARPEPGRSPGGSSPRVAAQAERELLLTLSALVDKSVVRRGDAGRYEMHELLKQYAAEKLAGAHDELEQAHAGHLAYYAALLDDLQVALMGHRQLEALQRMEAEIEDVRAAWQWALAHDRVAEVEQMWLALSLFCELRGRFEEGEELFRLATQELGRLHQAGALAAGQKGTYALVMRTLGVFCSSRGQYAQAYGYFRKSFDLVQGPQDSPDVAPAQRALLNMLLGFGAHMVADEEVERLYRESLQMFAANGYRWAIAMAHLVQGDFAHYHQNDMDLARRLRQESLAIFESLGNRWGMTLCLNDLATMAFSLGEYAESQRLSLRSLELCQEIGDPWRMVSCLLNLGQVVTALGEYHQALDYYQESLDWVRSSGNRSVIAVHLDCIGYVHTLLREFGEAEKFFRESLTLNRANGDDRGSGMALLNLGNVATARGDYRQAQKYLEESLALLELSDMPWGVAMCLRKLGIVECLYGQFPQARQFFNRALKVSMAIKRFPEALEIIVALSEALARDGRLAAAVELLTFSQQHPAIAQEAKKRAGELLAGLAAELPKKEFAAAGDAGRGWNLDVLTEAILTSDRF